MTIKIWASEAIDTGLTPVRRIAFAQSEEQGCHAVVMRAIASMRRRTVSVALSLRLGRPAIDIFYYVYLLKSEMGDHHDVGRTRDLKSRLQKRNQGGCVHAAKLAPWVIETSVAFRSEKKLLNSSDI